MQAFYCIAFILALCACLVQGKRIMVLGANGATGKRCVDLALRRGMDVTAVTRSGELADPPTFSLAKRLTTIKGDVKDLSTLPMQGVDACIFCASQSKEGGTAAEVDYQGVVNAGKRCIDANVPRLVVVSSGATSKPWSPVFLFLNLFGGIMTNKAKGEQAIRDMYRGQPEALGYTIVRPGGLTLEEPKGVSGIELNQYDEKSGRISRWDVAELCLESVDLSSTSRTTIECYNKDTGKPLSQVGLSNLFKMKEEAPAIGKFEHRGSTWKEIFTGLVRD